MATWEPQSAVASFFNLTIRCGERCGVCRQVKFFAPGQPCHLETNSLNGIAMLLDFVVIYIAEAHAQDEWPLGRRVCLNQQTAQPQGQRVKDQLVAHLPQVPLYISHLA
jgi:hypothetical protein